MKASRRHNHPADQWLRVIANADPGNLDQARAEARAEFAKELDAMEVEK
jgi:hypothetical protein